MVLLKKVHNYNVRSCQREHWTPLTLSFPYFEWAVVDFFKIFIPQKVNNTVKILSWNSMWDFILFIWGSRGYTGCSFSQIILFLSTRSHLYYCPLHFIFPLFIILFPHPLFFNPPLPKSRVLPLHFSRATCKIHFQNIQCN